MSRNVPALRLSIASIVAAASGLLAALAVPSIAHADAAGPTDYTTEIVGVTPASALDAVTFRIVGGDAFVEATVEPGHELVVLGYRPDEEPYLRIGADGAVDQNTRSYATYYNEDRYGTDDIPEQVDTEATPEWERVGDGGTWAWHDHRAHWMGDEPLIGLDPGESLPTETIPMMLDGEPIWVDVVTTYLPEPSPIPGLVGVVLGVLIGLVGIWLGRASTVLSLLVLAGSALLAGLAQFWSLPATTGPLVIWWLLPAVALGCGAAVIATYGRSIWLESGLVSIGALQLLLWAWTRRDHATAAYVPTDLPMWFDRVITTCVLAGSAIVLVGTLWRLWRTETVPRLQPGSGARATS